MYDNSVFAVIQKIRKLPWPYLYPIYTGNDEFRDFQTPRADYILARGGWAKPILLREPYKYLMVAIRHFLYFMIFSLAICSFKQQY